MISIQYQQQKMPKRDHEQVEERQCITLTNGGKVENREYDTGNQTS